MCLPLAGFAFTAGASGIYALGSADQRLIPASALSNPYVDGLALRFFWDQIEPAEDQVNWSLMDQQIAAARANGKKASISITPGIHTPAWVYAAGAAPFTYLWNRPFGPAECSEQRIPIPWDQVYLSKWGAFVRAMGRRYANDPAVRIVKITGINSASAEINLPHDGGAANVQCPGGGSLDANWRRLGYSRDRVKSAFQAIGDVFAQSFPHQVLAFGITPIGFPMLDNGAETGWNGGSGQSEGNFGQGSGLGLGRGALGGNGFGSDGMFAMGRRSLGQGGSGFRGFGGGRVRGDILLARELMEAGVSRYDGRFVLMSGGLSGFFSWKPPRSLGDVKFADQMLSDVTSGQGCKRMSRSAFSCDPHEALQMAINRGIESGAIFLEIYMSDILNPHLQDVLAQAHSSFASRQ